MLLKGHLFLLSFFVRVKCLFLDFVRRSFFPAHLFSGVLKAKTSKNPKTLRLENEESNPKTLNLANPRPKNQLLGLVRPRVCQVEG